MNGGPQDKRAPNPEAVFAQSMAALQRGDFDQAIRHGDRLLEISNSAPPAIVWAVRLRLEAQRWQDAVELGMRAAGTPGISGFLGNAYEGLGELVRAQQFYEAACEEQPDNPAWLYHHGSVLSRLYRDFEAMECLRIAAAIGPEPAGLVRLADYELTFGNPAAAQTAADRAAAIEPKNVEAQTIAARALLTMGQSDEAEIRWQKAISLAPGNEGLPLQRAISLVRHGQFETGIQSLNDIIRSKPRSALAYAQIAMAKRLSPDDRPFIEAMEELAGDERLDHESLTSLQFALGKSFDNLGEFEPAMRHFDEANRLQSRTILETGGFDRPGYAQNMLERTRIYSREAVEELAAKGNPSTVPIFVLGMIRSGTTLAEQILSSHPMVFGAGEQDFWINADLRLTDYAFDHLSVDALRQAAGVYLRLLGGFAKDGAARVVDKQPGNLLLVGALHMAFPNAKIIHMRRNPVDTAVSIWTTHVRTSTRFVNDKSNIVYAYQQHEQLMQHWRSIVPPERFLDVTYESLVTDRDAQTRRILEFCDLPWCDECLAPEKNRKVVITPSLWQVRQPVYRTSIDRWKNYEPWLGEFRTLLGWHRVESNGLGPIA